VSCLYQHGHTGNSGTAFLVHEIQQVAEWRDAGAWKMCRCLTIATCQSYVQARRLGQRRRLKTRLTK